MPTWRWPPRGSKHLGGHLIIFVKLCVWRLLICPYSFTDTSRCIKLSLLSDDVIRLVPLAQVNFKARKLQKGVLGWWFLSRLIVRRNSPSNCRRGNPPSIWYEIKIVSVLCYRTSYCPRYAPFTWRLCLQTQFTLLLLEIIVLGILTFIQT